MSLDGYVAAPDDSVPHIFDWYGNGTVAFDWPGNDMVSYMTPTGAAYLRELVEQTGALVVGRRVFDYTDGMGRTPSDRRAGVRPQPPRPRGLGRVQK